MACIGGRKKEKKVMNQVNPSVSSLKASSKPSTLRKLSSNGSLASSKDSKTPRSSKSFFSRQRDEASSSSSFSPSFPSFPSSSSFSKKSPIAQMREEFDDLKVQKQEQDRLIAVQAAELETLKKQLAD